MAATPTTVADADADADGHAARPGGDRVRIPALDGLRGLAVAAVVGFHYWPDTVPGGYLGVSVFFTLSGFLIATIVRDEHRRTGRVAPGAFWARRVRRLLPMSTLTLASVLAAVALTEPDALQRVAGDVVAGAAYVANWRVMTEPGGYDALFDTTVRPLGHFWSLSIEEQFYLVGPLVLAGPARRLLPALAAVTVVGVWWWWGSPDAYYATLVRVGEIAAGVGLAIVVARRSFPLGSLRIAGLAGAVVLVALTFTWTETEPALARGGLLVVAAASVAVIAWCLGDRRWCRPLGLSPLVWLGRRSYAVYLVHWPLLELTSLDPVLALVVTLAVAELSWRLIEEPMLRRRGWDRGVAFVVAATVALGVVAAAIALWVEEPAPEVGRLDEVEVSAGDSGAPETPQVVQGPVLVLGDSQAEAVGGGLDAHATAAGAGPVRVVAIRGCSGLVDEGWDVRFDAGESGEFWPGGYEGCERPPLAELIDEVEPVVIVVAEWGTATLDHRDGSGRPWLGADAAPVAAAWSARYDAIGDAADAAGVPVVVLTGPSCTREAPCAIEERLDAYNDVLATAGRPVLDLAPVLAADPDRYRTVDGAHVEEGRAAFLLAAEAVVPFLVEATVTPSP